MPQASRWYAAGPAGLEPGPTHRGDWDPERAVWDRGALWPAVLVAEASACYNLSVDRSCSDPFLTQRAVHSRGEWVCTAAPRHFADQPVR